MNTKNYQKELDKIEAKQQKDNQPLEDKINQKSDVIENKILSDFTDQELVIELRSRGYEVNCKKITVIEL